MILYLGLGSNLGNRDTFLRDAIACIGERVGRVTACSAFHETKPEGFPSANLFLNAAIAVDTDLSPEAVLAATQLIEREAGRTQKSQGEVYADRTLDIDLLLAGEGTLPIAASNLQLPHPRLSERAFVLIPLAEIAPDVRHEPSGMTISQLLQRLEQGYIEEAHDNPATLRAINSLLPQLSPAAKPLSPERLTRLIHAPQSRIYMIRDAAHGLCAMLTIVLCSSPTGRKAWVEDVVVDSKARGHGYARRLLAHAAQEARRLGAKSLNLTSNPERRAANALYRSAGFEHRITNVYRFTLDASQ